MQQPPRETRTAIIATPGSGPIPYWRSTFAPAMNVSPGKDRGRCWPGRRTRRAEPVIDSSTASRQQRKQRRHRAHHVDRGARRGAAVICVRIFRIRGAGSGCRSARQIHPGESVAAGGIGVGAQVDRHRHAASVAIGTPERLVVAPQRTAEAGEVGVVDRAPGRLGGAMEGRERDVDGFGARRQASPAQQRRAARRPGAPPARSEPRSRRRRTPPNRVAR